ncbi:uncharacterized protein LOC126570507 [Anopheles aquasalis]|uniref:uncharacterized protein LOC126570507 n=1 Tax=Anopheles aquasalis TaxID=42839 RepID=UPI00215A3D2C|nr:uncharacterized protein LOC126570507 [Anopheles aquasalis]XP_050084259.1 uncharacterized protein LOC126570507 [Anopheles aquasalis]XP_050084260.1 uncharacterized protein LOC126570507 [Anopheles aquasalis]
MNYFSVLSILTVMICLNDRATPFADARKCYVCGEGADAPFKSLATVPTVEGTCEGFRPEEKYAFDCPPTYTSCLTQVDGDIEMRTCGENFAINDCKSANGINYCYCSTELCNRLTRQEIRRSITAAQAQGQQHLRNRLYGNQGHPDHHRQPPNNSDDEDMAESSGMDSDRSEQTRSHASSNEHRDVTTQITITLKPVANAGRRNDQEQATAAAGGSNRTTDSTDRSRDSNAIPAVSSAFLASLNGLILFLFSSYALIVGDQY